MILQSFKFCENATYFVIASTGTREKYKQQIKVI